MILDCTPLATIDLEGFKEQDMLFLAPPAGLDSWLLVSGRIGVGLDALVTEITATISPFSKDRVTL